MKREIIPIPSFLVRDKHLSVGAKFTYVVLAYYINEDKTANELAAALGVGVDTFRKYRKELEDNGWVIVSKQQNANGKFGSVKHELFIKEY